ncbi:MAG: UDP-N-acetylmuramate dehydrogenase [Candidatus Brocadiales bacterium]|nr:UDP-N-acetylmuramate dehydrogenase [Candidatus Bathyanammoxibius amoris]
MVRALTDGAFKYEHPLCQYTSFGVGGSADVFVEPSGVSQLQDALRYGNEQGLDTYVLGKGCNLLISDSGVRGMVVHLNGQYFNRIRRKDSEVIVCGGGASLSRLVRGAAYLELEGLETLVGVPGSVGGAVAMNAGGRYGTIGSCVRGVTAVGYDGELYHYEGDEIDFGYRTSSISNQIILEVELELKAGSKDAILKRMWDLFSEKRKTQPLDARSAGCIFKNPKGYSAGALIDKSGLKSSRVGDATVSCKHANFIVNLGSATASQILELIHRIREEVKRRIGLLLDMEIKTW